MNHKQTYISFGDNEAEVDVEIAPIILECWRNDIDTALSCQENKPGVAWINFMAPYDASDFMNIVANRYKKGIKCLYNRIAHNWSSNKDCLHVVDINDPNMISRIIKSKEKGERYVLTINEDNFAYIETPNINLWDYDILPFDFNLIQTLDEDDYIVETHKGKPEFSFSVSIRFPRTDMPVILKRLMAASKKREKKKKI